MWDDPDRYVIASPNRSEFRTDGIMTDDIEWSQEGSNDYG